jgi:hypothetical protein
MSKIGKLETSLSRKAEFHEFHFFNVQGLVELGLPIIHSLE